MRLARLVRHYLNLVLWRRSVTIVILLSAESKGRRFSKRLAEKRLRALQQENVPPPPTPPPLPPPPPQTPQMGATLTVSVFVFTLQQSLGLDIYHELITVPHTQRRALSERRPLYERRTEYNTGPPPASTKYVALFILGYHQQPNHCYGSLS